MTLKNDLLTKVQKPIDEIIQTLSPYFEIDRSDFQHIFDLIHEIEN